MAPVANRLTIDSIGSTSSRGIGVPANLKSKSPRRGQRFWVWLSTRSVYSLKILYWPLRVAGWSLKTVAGGGGGEGVVVAEDRLLGDHVEAHATDPRGRPREVSVHELLAEANGLEDLGAPVGLDRGDPHLGDDLQDPFVQRLDVVLRGLRVVHPWE